MTVSPKLIQSIISYVSIIMGILTTQLQGIHLPVVASIILGVFGVLLHPQTSITATPAATTPVTAPPAEGNPVK